jgi:hypothetical protein
MPPNGTNFINVLPDVDHTHVVIGSTATPGLPYQWDVERVGKLDLTEKLKVLSDVMTRHTETWGMSLDLWERWKSTGKDNQVMSEMQRVLHNKNLPIDESVNVFD